MDGEWYPLPSGKMICHVGDFKLKAAAQTACQEAGGYLAEFQSRDDMQTLNYVMWSGRKASTKSASKFRVGAVAENMQWRWEQSGDMVDIGPGRIIKPQDEDEDLSAYDGQHLYLKLVGFNSAVSYLNGLPYFDLYLDIGADAEEEFICMKDGLGSAANFYQFNVALNDDNYDSYGLLKKFKPGEIIRDKMRVKIPSGISLRDVKFQGIAYDDDMIRICKVFLSHVGRNFPCLRNPLSGPATIHNTSTYSVISYYKPNDGHQIDFTQIRNYGSPGYFTQDGNVDDDSVEVTVLSTSIFKGDSWDIGSKRVRFLAGNGGSGYSKSVFLDAAGTSVMNYFKLNI